MKSFVYAVAIVAVSSAIAQDYDYTHKWGLGGSLGYNTPIFGNQLNDVADGDISYGLHGRYHFNTADGLEFGFTRHELDDTKIHGNVIDLTYFKRLAPTARLTPVIGAGLGVVDFHNYDPSSLKLGVKLRAGAEYALNDMLSLGLNVDYQHINKMLFAKNLPTRNGHILAARFGVTFYFGGEESKKEVATTHTMVEKDSDGDGIVDSKDKCPNTKKNVKVNAYGCAEKEKASITIDVKFDSGKSTYAQEYVQDLKNLAQFMKEHPKTRVEIQGHTDSSGSKVLNKNLSQSRANAVKDYLIQNEGIQPDRLTAQGFGDEQPIASNETVEGRAKNRRVMAVIAE